MIKRAHNFRVLPRHYPRNSASMVIKIDAYRPNKKVIQKAVQVIQNGGLVIFPTETVYGLGADAFNAKAVARIFKVKGRPEGKPLIVHVSKKSTLDVLTRSVPLVAHELVKKFWPGPLTLVLLAQPYLPRAVTGRIARTLILPSIRVLARKRRTLQSTSMIPIMEVPVRGGRTVAVRMPHHSVALALIRAAGPLAAPSANFSGDKPPRSVREIPRKLLEKVDLVLDAGKCPVGVPSTVLDLIVSPPKILREGAIKKKQLKKFL